MTSFGNGTAISSQSLNTAFANVQSGVIPVPASTLTGTTLASNVVSSSLTSVGTLSAGAIPASLLTGTTLPATIVSSSLTSVGTLTSLTVAGNIGWSASTYLTPVTGGTTNYGSVKVTGTPTSSGWSGYSINGDAVFMSQSVYYGLYDNTNLEWGILCTRNGATDIYFNGVTKLTTQTGGVIVSGQLTSGTFVTNNSSPSLELGDWSTSATWSAVEGYNGYLLLGNTSDRACYLRSNNTAAVNIGANGTNTLVVNNGNIVVNGTTVNSTLNVVGGTGWFSAMSAGSGSTVVNNFGFLQYISSRRELKENIVPVGLSDGLNRVLALRPVEFTMKPEYLTDANEYTPFDVKRGFIAQETAEVDHRYGQWGWVNENQMMATTPAINGELPLEEATPIYWNHDAVIADLVASIQNINTRLQQMETA